MNTTMMAQTTLNAIEWPGTPWLLVLEKNLGKWPSVDIWCSDRAVPVIAFRAERMSARMSIQPTSQSSTVEAELAPNTAEAKWTNIVLGSIRAELPSAWTPSTMTNARGIIV